MYNDPYQEDPIGVQPTEQIPPMEELQPRPTPPPQYPVHSPPVSENVSPSEEEDVESRHEEARTVVFAIGKLNDYLLWFAVVLEITLLIRLLLKLIGAIPTNLFAGFLYALTDLILFPFSGIVSTGSNYANQILETIIGMLIYWLIFWAVRRFLRILISSPEVPS